MAKRIGKNDVTSPYRDLKGAKDYFAIGKIKLEELAKQSDSILKIGRRKIYNVRKMEEWLINGGEVIPEHSLKYNTIEDVREYMDEKKEIKEE